MMSWHILWVIHTNKCGSVQLLDHYTVPHEIYHLINCPCHLLMYLHESSYACFVLNLQREYWTKNEIHAGTLQDRAKSPTHFLYLYDI